MVEGDTAKRPEYRGPPAHQVPWARAKDALSYTLIYYKSHLLQESQVVQAWNLTVTQSLFTEVVEWGKGGHNDTEALIFWVTRPLGRNGGDDASWAEEE